MFRFRLACFLHCMTLLSSVASATMTGSDAVKQMHDLYGTYSCVLGGKKVDLTFEPMFGGRSMRITNSGGDAEMVSFDVRRQLWIDESIQAHGTYSVMEGVSVKQGIDFKAVYPPGFDGALAVRNLTPKMMTTAFSMTQTGAKKTVRQTCVKS